MKLFSNWLCLFLLWLLSNLSDRLWLSIDHNVPGWDESNHLTGSLNYLQALQKIELFNSSWWENLWRVSSKYPPLTYIGSVPFQEIFGKGIDQALAVNFISSAILIVSIYILGKTLFNERVGLLASVLSVLFPMLYLERLVYLTDTLLVALTIASYTLLTLWRIEQKNLLRQWFYSFAFGVFFGLALLAKQSVMFFLLIPLIWLNLEYLFKKSWLKIIQISISFCITTLICWPWYQANWIYSFGTYSSSVTTPAHLQGNPPLNSFASWFYYWQELPEALSWLLILVPIVGIILNLLKLFPKTEKKSFKDSFIWMAIYCLAAYLICTLNINKNTRYIMPYIPILSIFLAYGLSQWRGRWQKVQYWTIGIAVLVMLGKLYPIPVLAQVSQAISPGDSNYPYTGKPWPNQEVIQTIIKTTPSLQATLGVIPNTSKINHNNMNYYGALADFQVFGRELGVQSAQVSQDANSFDWLLTKTGDNERARTTQLQLATQLTTDPSFNLLETWSLPDQSKLQLYHRQKPLVTVIPTQQKLEKIQLKEVIVPSLVQLGSPTPISYRWVGPAKAFQNGIVLITWINDNQEVGWIQDHSIGMGQLYGKKENYLEVLEQTAMLPEGVQEYYNLRVTYIDPINGTSYQVEIPPTRIKTSVSAPIVKAPVLDQVTQLRNLALDLKQGIKGVENIFYQVARLNQYEPNQAYLKETAQSLSYRLEKEQLSTDRRINYLYGLLLSRVLSQDVNQAIATLQQLIKLQPKNPFLYAYLSVVHLYNWDINSASIALKPVKNDKTPEVILLQRVTDILKGNILETISLLKNSQN